VQSYASQLIVRFGVLCVLRKLCETWVPAGAWIFSPCHHFQTSFGAHPPILCSGYGT